MRKPPGLCHRCKTVERRFGCSYCVECDRLLRREYRQAKPYAKPSGVRRARPDACNCADPRCTGLRCDSIRYGTAV